MKASKNPVDEKDQKLKALKEFEKCVRDVLNIFMHKQEQQTIRLGPYTKDERFVLCEVTDDLDLTTQSEFEEMTRHTYVHVYKEGAHPDEIRVAKLKEQMNEDIKPITKKSKTTPVVNKLDAPSNDLLFKVGKRDSSSSY